MVRRRAADAGIETAIGCNTFRAMAGQSNAEDWQRPRQRHAQNGSAS
jgi:hypothetical protein